MKRLIVRLSLLFLFSIVPLGVYNYMLDYYGVFHEELLNRYNEPNVRFLKTKHLLNSPKKYTSIIFGSSRTGKILAHKFDDSVYNMYYSEGVPAEFKEDLELILSTDTTIKMVYIGLDEFSFMINPEKHKDQLLRMGFKPDFLGKASNYLQFLIDPPKIGLPKYSIPTDFDIRNSGNPLHFKVDSLIENDIEKHIASKKFISPKKYYNNRIDQTCSELQDILEMCSSSGVEVRLFFNPAFINTYKQYDFELISKIKSKLADISVYVDFSGPNSITMNPYYYYESNHYRYMIGDSIWMHLSGLKTSTFGKKVNSSNVNSLLANERTLW